MSTAIVWFRRDLRLEDNPALSAALQAHDRVVCAYIHAPDEEAPWAPGAASLWWLHHSLAALDRDLRKLGGALHIRRGPTEAALKKLVDETGAVAVYWNRLYEPALMSRDTRLKHSLREHAIEATSCNASLLFEPWQILTQQETPYRVFTPFWRNLRPRWQPQPPMPRPKRMAAVIEADAAALDALQLLPTIRWDAEFSAHWQPGERGASKMLQRFVTDALSDYQQGRDRPDRAQTSRLSPHLHFGEVGPRQIGWFLHDVQGDRAARRRADAEPFLRELGWREFSHHLLFHFPQTQERNLNPQFDRFSWASHDATAIARWQRGITGVPIVDAGMRELWRSGWMHNRVRMIVASYLTKNLRQHWLHGARWFWDTLLDADLPNNTQGWQWTAGTGADAAPYFRIFNPVSQGERFDPDGHYVRRWVPELADVPTSLIHRPWQHSGLLDKLRYPKPMVDLSASREAALAAYRQMRNG